MLLCAAVILQAAAFAQRTASPFNGLALPDSVPASYSFIVTGHLHGSSGNISGFPAASLLANLDTLNKLDASYMISLGDLFLDVDSQILANYHRSFFSKIGMPLFNAVGNHDLSRNIYPARFGNTFGSFIYGSEMSIILDTEKNDGSIKGEQMEFLRKALDRAVSDTAVKNIFIYSHRPVWAEGDPVYSEIFKDNTQTAIGSNDYHSEVLPLVDAAGKLKNTFWISGSMGGMAPASFFYDRKGNVTYMCTAIRDLPRDAVLLVTSTRGKLSFKGVSLTGQRLDPIETYNVAFWQKGIKQKPAFNTRLLPYLALQMLKHHYFWIGFASCALVIILFAGIRIRRKRKHAARTT